MICHQLDQCVNSLDFSGSLPSNTPCLDETISRKCIVFADRRSQPSCSEHRKSYTLNIGTHSFDCVCVHIDSGVVDTEDCNKCDYAFFLKDTKKHVILVELKGKNVGHALEQINATLQLEPLRDVFVNKKVYGRISCTSAAVPRIYSNMELNLRRKLLRLGGNLKIQNTPFIEMYDQLDD